MAGGLLIVGGTLDRAMPPVRRKSTHPSSGALLMLGSPRAWQTSGRGRVTALSRRSFQREASCGIHCAYGRSATEGKEQAPAWVKVVLSNRDP
jgi:hypothetical protein